MHKTVLLSLALLTLGTAAPAGAIDLDLSINAGILLIKKYMSSVSALGVAPAGSSYFWKLVKLAHSMGSYPLTWLASGLAVVIPGRPPWNCWGLDQRQDLTHANAILVAPQFAMSGPRASGSAVEGDTPPAPTPAEGDKAEKPDKKSS